MNLAVVFHAATMVDAPSSALLRARILLPALKLHVCMENGAITVLAVLLVLPLVKEFPLCADNAIWFTNPMVRFAPDSLSIALDATSNAAQLTVKLVNGVLTLISNLHAVLKFAPVHALSLFTHLVAEPSAPLSLTMTPPLLVVLSTVLWTIGAHGLSARRVFQTVRLPDSKLDVERFSFKLHVAAKIALPSSLKLVCVHPLHAIEVARFPIGNLGVIAMLAVVTVSRSECALLL